MMRKGPSFMLAVGGLLALLSGCGESRPPVSPAPPQTPARSSPPPGTVAPQDEPLEPALVFPPVPAPALVYDRVTPMTYVAGLSRFVLHPNGSFEKQYLTSRFGFAAFPGFYWHTSSGIVFAFGGWSIAGPWEASATVQGDSLTVHYNVIMALSDFEDGVYVLASED